jgi:hypothetical protein
MDSTLTVTLTSADSISDQNNYYVDSVMIRVDSASFVNVVSFKDNVNSIFVFPNPASNKLYVEWEGKADARLIILNSLGAEVKSETLKRNDTYIDVSLLPEGIYFVQVRTSVGVLTKKILVRH